MATCLSKLINLEYFSLEFESPPSSPNQEARHPLPPTRFDLPVLNRITFKGVYEYMEDFLARINAPLCQTFETTFFDDIHFHTPNLIQFISRIQMEAPSEVDVVFSRDGASVTLRTSSVRSVKVEVLSKVPNWQLSFLVEICALCLPFLSATKKLYIYEKKSFYC